MTLHELYQAEWCPSSQRVRARLTERGVDFVARQVPAERDERHALRSATGVDGIPTLIADGRVLAGEDAITAWLEEFPEPPGAGAHRDKARRVQEKQMAERIGA